MNALRTFGVQESLIYFEQVRKTIIDYLPPESFAFSRQSSFDGHIPSNRGSRILSTSSSPPPHVLGQIVEVLANSKMMGQHSRTATSTTTSRSASSLSVSSHTVDTPSSITCSTGAFAFSAEVFKFKCRFRSFLFDHEHRFIWRQSIDMTAFKKESSASATSKLPEFRLVWVKFAWSRTVEKCKSGLECLPSTFCLFRLGDDWHDGR